MLKTVLLAILGVKPPPNWIELAAEEGWRAFPWSADTLEEAESIMMRLLDKK